MEFINKIVSIVIQRDEKDRFFFVNRIYTYAWALLFIGGGIASSVIGDHELGNQLFEWGIYGFLLSLINLVTLIVGGMLFQRRDLLNFSNAAPVTNGKTPLKVVANQITKGMLKNLNSKYQSQH